MYVSREKSSTVSSGSSSSGEWDKIDGGVPSKAANSTANATANATPPANATPNATPTAVPNNTSVIANNVNTFDHVERNSILNDPRAGR